MNRKTPTPAGLYYDEAWEIKLQRPEYATLERRWRTRWDFVAEHIRGGSEVLDVGCGDGVLGGRLIDDSDCQVVGVDVSPYALERAAQRGVIGEAVDIDVQDLPFSDGSFDAAIASCVLEHVAHPEHVLTEMYRVLKPGGSAFISLPNPLTLKIRWAFVRGRFHHDFLHSLPGEGIHYRFWRVTDGLESMLEEIGVPFEVKVKRIEVKNPNLGTRLKRFAKPRLIRFAPSLFGEYVHFELRRPL